jgi:hypothetical protein
MDVRVQAVHRRVVVYVKVIVRADCVIISFHEEEDCDEDE